MLLKSYCGRPTTLTAELSRLLPMAGSAEDPCCSQVIGSGRSSPEASAGGRRDE
jgi:hypothetical protein